MEAKMIQSHELEGYVVDLYLKIYPEDYPNAYSGIWKREDRHVGGETVAYQGDRETSHWRSINYTPAELAKEYAAQGRANPSAEAYASMQLELRHELEAYGIGLFARVTKNGIELLNEHVIRSYVCDNAECCNGDLQKAGEILIADYAEEPKTYVEQARKVLRDLCA